MLVIKFQFPAGRYHATPWGQNVNEGHVEWPPSPYRLSRSIIDIWKRKKPTWPNERVLPILKAISSSPYFKLPQATAAHTRAYLNSNEKDPLKQQLIFDSFVAVKRSDPLLMAFPCDLDDSALKAMNQLLSEMNYFGRSESWVQATAYQTNEDNDWNCIPVNDEQVDLLGENVPLACVMPIERHDKLPYKPKTATWLDALCMTTQAILAEGWSVPPAMQWVDYVRPADALRFISSESIKLQKKYRFAKYALHSKVLPRVQETISFSEKIRAYLMGIHKRLNDNDPSKVSKLFSGKNADGRLLTGHKHAYYWPMDEDRDGRIDHLLIVSEDRPFDSLELQALDSLNSVWQSNRRSDVKLILLSLNEELSQNSSKTWISATPFVTSRHYRKGRGTYIAWLSKEIARECAFHSLPTPSNIQMIQHTFDNHPIRWMDFMRSRKGHTPMRGHGFVLSFDEAVTTPFALGSLCHFGLGLFVPYSEG